MNGNLSKRRKANETLIAIQMSTITVCTIRYRGVPKNRASRSAVLPNDSGS